MHPVRGRIANDEGEPSRCGQIAGAVDRVWAVHGVESELDRDSWVNSESDKFPPEGRRRRIDLGRREGADLQGNGPLGLSKSSLRPVIIRDGRQAARVDCGCDAPTVN